MSAIAMLNPASPTVYALLRRDYPSQVFGGFALLFGIGTIVGGAVLTYVEPDDRAAAVIFTGMFGLFALGCGLVCALRLRMIARLVRRGVIVDGVIRRNETNSEEIWFLEAEYEFAGRKHRTTKGTGRKSRFVAGDGVRVLVDPERPDRAWIAE